MQSTPAFLTAAALAFSAAAPPAQKIEAFQFEAKTLGGRTITHEHYRDTVLIVDLWGTWCPPCREAVPVLQELHRKYKHHGLEVVGLNYETGAQPAETARKFAIEHGITYTLALGTPAIQQQVPGFKGYPTLLLFKRGLQHDRTESGFDRELAGRLEAWVREALGLPEAAAAAAAHRGAAPEPGADAPAAAAPAAPEEREALPPGVIHQPGDHDTGFDFEAADADGNRVAFAELRGKPVVLVLTSTWDGEAANTAALLNKLQAEHAATAHVLAASLEISTQREAQLRAIESFRKKHEVRYRIFPAGLSLQKRIHMFAGMPLFLVFDAEGRLILREAGASEKVLESVRQVLPAQPK